MSEARLDILLYSHDGRGLGHVSRSAAIGMAIRRLYPDLKVCLMTGCRQTGELIGEVPLDWLKLPAYDTEVIEGKSTGVDGPSGFTDDELGILRAEQIKQIMYQYRPRLVLVDHTPQGKHRELVPALHLSSQTKWFLGVRGVVGGVAQAGSTLAKELFQQFYSRLLWYGDRLVLGTEHIKELSERFNTRAEECGYVSRLTELLPLYSSSGTGRSGCTVSIPWLGEHTRLFIEKFVEAMMLVGPHSGRFRIFVGSQDLSTLRKMIQDLDFCTLEPFSEKYVQTLSCSKSAVIFGGYNSLVDIMATGIPAMVVLRDMRDREQHDHLQALAEPLGKRIAVVDEKDCSVEQLYRLLDNLMNLSPDPFATQVNLGGAEQTARVLAQSLER